MVVDLRGEFRGMPDHEIYQIAMDRYWDRCSRDIVIWIGGAARQAGWNPGMADWGIFRGAFFCDLSAQSGGPRRAGPDQRHLHRAESPRASSWAGIPTRRIPRVSQVTLTSSYGLRMEGLNSLPNISFNTQFPSRRISQFTNNHNVEPR